MPEDIYLELLPGMDGTGELFRPLSDVLRGEFDFSIASYPRDVSVPYPALHAQKLDGLASSKRPCVIVAESFSTPLALWIAAQQPPSLLGVVLCAGFVTSPVEGWKRQILRRFALISFRLPCFGWVTRYAALSADSPKLLVDEVRSAINSVKPEVLADRLQQILQLDARAACAKIRVPVLYLQARQDRLVPPQCAQELIGLLPDLQIQTLDGPHLLLQDRPAECARAIREFIASLAQR